MCLRQLCLSANKKGKQELQLNSQLVCLSCETNLEQYLPINVGIADAAREILILAAGRPSIVESFHGRN